MQSYQMLSQLNVSILEDVTVMNKDSMSDHGPRGYEEGSHPHGPLGPLSLVRALPRLPAKKYSLKIVSSMI